MNQVPNPSVDRRAWLRSGLRWAAVGGISLISGAVLLRRASPVGQASCRRAPACGGCARLANCQLPPAMRTKGEPCDD